MLPMISRVFNLAFILSVCVLTVLYGNNLRLYQSFTSMNTRVPPSLSGTPRHSPGWSADYIGCPPTPNFALRCDVITTSVYPEHPGLYRIYMPKVNPLQQRFTLMTAQLIFKAHLLGYGLTYGDAYRDDRVAYGHKKSLHRMRLAVDFNLWKDGEYLSDSEAHYALGQYWESLGGSWGGRWGDGNHYSLSYGGMR